MASPRSVKSHGKPYRITFALILITGNLTRYEIVRPQVERDRTVKARWMPIRTWVMNDWLRFLPASLRVRARHFLDSWRLFAPPFPQAVVMHAFETYPLYALFLRLFRRKTVLVWNADDFDLDRCGGLEGWLRRNAIARTSLFVPFSSWAAEKIHAQYPTVPASHITPLHPGLDLTRWRQRASLAPSGRFKLLFVGGQPVRKGLDTLLTAFEQELDATCELHIATQSLMLPPAMKDRIARLPHAHLYLDLQPESAELMQLFAACDAFVLPTSYDASSWVCLEALATGLPVIASGVGGVPDIVRDGQTGLLIPPRDSGALAQAVRRLQSDAALRDRLVAQGRRHVEEQFDASKNTATLLSQVKSLIDEQAKAAR